MKRILILAATTAAVALSSCSKNEVTEVFASSDNVNQIGFSAASKVTRGTETTTATFKAEGGNVTLYCYDTEGSTPIIELLSYNTEDEAWYSTTQWSAVALNGSDAAQFYALHTGFEAIESTAKATEDGIVFDEYTVQGEASEELTYTDGSTMTMTYTYPASNEDLIHMQEDVTSIPVGGIISGTFDHSMSRIEFWSNQGTYKPYVKCVIFKNVPSAGKATVSNTGVISWATTEDSEQDYLYYSNVNPALVLCGTAGDDGAAESKDTGLTIYDTGRIADMLDDDTYYPSATDANNIIIIPQTIPATTQMAQSGTGSGVLENSTTNSADEDTTPTPTEEESSSDASSSTDVVDPVVTSEVTVAAVLGGASFTDITEPYVQVLYRMRDSNDSESVVGYLHAEDCPAYQNMITNNETIYPTTLGALSHLYVLVGFPFSQSFTFDPSYDYDINIGFGVTGGILLYDYYFAANGEPTNIPIAGINPGEQVLASEDSYIGLSITVNSWNDYSSNTADM